MGYVGRDPSPLRRPDVFNPRNFGACCLFRRIRPPVPREAVRLFRAKSSTDHCYWAISALQRLRADGRGYWKSDPQALERWSQGYNVLLEFLNTLGARAKQPLATVMREFVQEFEHSVGRIVPVAVLAVGPRGESVPRAVPLMGGVCLPTLHLRHPVLVA